MLPRRELNVGKSYVNENERIAREVVEMSPITVKYHIYDLSTGKLVGALRACRKKAFIQWADREATHEEAANLKQHEANELYKTDTPIQDKEPDRPHEQSQLITHNEMINRY